MNAKSHNNFYAWDLSGKNCENREGELPILSR